MGRLIKKIGSTLLSRLVITALLVLLQVLFVGFEIWKLSSYYVYIDIVLRILSFGAVIFLLYRHSNASVKISWIVLILSVPLLGGLIYILFGHVFMFKRLRKNVDRAEKATTEPYHPQNQACTESAAENKQVANLCYYIIIHDTYFHALCNLTPQNFMYGIPHIPLFG